LILSTLAISYTFFEANTFTWCYHSIVPNIVCLSCCFTINITVANGQKRSSITTGNNFSPNYLMNACICFNIFWFVKKIIPLRRGFCWYKYRFWIIVFDLLTNSMTVNFFFLSRCKFISCSAGIRGIDGINVYE
jgi:hypothetical protein